VSATQTLPHLAGFFDEASGSFEPSSSEMAFMRSGDLGDSAFGPYPAVADAYGLLKQCVDDTGTNLRLAGHALLTVVNDFAAQDDAAKREFQRLGGRL
jgi:hypothetical protein